MAFQTPIANTDVYKGSFFPQTIRDWNALPDSLISSAEDAEDSVAKFTSLLIPKSQVLVNDCRFGVSPVNYPEPDPDLEAQRSLRSDWTGTKTDRHVSWAYVWVLSCSGSILICCSSPISESLA